MSKSTPVAQPRTSAWRNPFGLALVAYYLVMAVVGLLIPDDILRVNGWARDFSDFMASVVPQIDRITALNIKPDMNRLAVSNPKCNDGLDVDILVETVLEEDL
ncbi:hypothetical protein, partial [Variovorax sp. CCNWLW235]|uniref:hypothetical protein n=1 Tax=Variovorax sp. CCNWLW235 TaxID=3127463 RepID=UPI003077FBD7